MGQAQSAPRSSSHSCKTQTDPKHSPQLPDPTHPHMWPLSLHPVLHLGGAPGPCCLGAAQLTPTLQLLAAVGPSPSICGSTPVAWSSGSSARRCAAFALTFRSPEHKSSPGGECVSECWSYSHCRVLTCRHWPDSTSSSKCSPTRAALCQEGKEAAVTWGQTPGTPTGWAGGSGEDQEPGEPTLDRTQG